MWELISQKLISCAHPQLLTCSAYQVTDFRKLVVLKKKTVENTKAKTVGDVDQQMVRCGILNGVLESNIVTQTCQSCGSGTCMAFAPHELVQVRG